MQGVLAQPKHEEARCLRRQLITVTILYTGSLALSDTFVSPLLWLRHVSTAGVLQFAAVQFFAMTGVFVWARRPSLPTETWIKGGVAITLGFLVGVLAGGRSLRHLSLILGILAGIGFGAFWQGLYMALATILRPRERDAFNGLLGTIETIAALAGPLAGAGLITLGGSRGFALVFAVSCAGLLPVFATALKADVEPMDTTPPAPRRRQWRWLLGAQGSRGLYQGVLMVAPGLAFFELIRSALWLGIVTSVASLFGLAGYWVTGRYGRRSFRRRFAWGGAAILTGAALWLGWRPDAAGLVGFSWLANLASPLQTVPMEACALDLVARQQTPAPQTVAEKELWLNAGRGVGLLLAAIVVGFRSGAPGLRWVLLGLPLAGLASAWCLSQFPAERDS